MQNLKILQLVNSKYLYLQPTVHEFLNPNSVNLFIFCSLSLSFSLSYFFFDPLKLSSLNSLKLSFLNSLLSWCLWVLCGFSFDFFFFFFFFWVYIIMVLPWWSGVAVVVRWKVWVCGDHYGGGLSLWIGMVEGVGLWWSTSVLDIVVCGGAWRQWVVVEVCVRSVVHGYGWRWLWVESFWCGFSLVGFGWFCGFCGMLYVWQCCGGGSVGLV